MEHNKAPSDYDLICNISHVYTDSINMYFIKFYTQL
uniref:Uncharacterized protein n=1 Tax=Anguilla anguilla TaxID=7936 RepID=A0A0E9P914_ANGAN